MNYPGILFGRGEGGLNKFTWGQRTKNGDLGAVSSYTLVKDYGGSCNSVQEMSFHIVKISEFLVL